MDGRQASYNYSTRGLTPRPPKAHHDSEPSTPPTNAADAMPRTGINLETKRTHIPLSSLTSVRDRFERTTELLRDLIREASSTPQHLDGQGIGNSGGSFVDISKNEPLDRVQDMVHRMRQDLSTISKHVTVHQQDAQDMEPDFCHYDGQDTQASATGREEALRVLKADIRALLDYSANMAHFARCQGGGDSGSESHLQFATASEQGRKGLESQQYSQHGKAQATKLLNDGKPIHEGMLHFSRLRTQIEGDLIGRLQHSFDVLEQETGELLSIDVLKDDRIRRLGLLGSATSTERQNLPLVYPSARTQSLIKLFVRHRDLIELFRGLKLSSADVQVAHTLKHVDF